MNKPFMGFHDLSFQQESDLRSTIKNRTPFYMWIKVNDGSIRITAKLVALRRRTAEIKLVDEVTPFFQGAKLTISKHDFFRSILTGQVSSIYLKGES